MGTTIDGFIGISLFYHKVLYTKCRPAVHCINFVHLCVHKDVCRLLLVL